MIQNKGIHNYTIHYSSADLGRCPTMYSLHQGSTLGCPLNGKVGETSWKRKFLGWAEWESQGKGQQWGSRKVCRVSGCSQHSLYGHLTGCRCHTKLGKGERLVNTQQSKKNSKLICVIRGKCLPRLCDAASLQPWLWTHNTYTSHCACRHGTQGQKKKKKLPEYLPQAWDYYTL